MNIYALTESDIYDLSESDIYGLEANVVTPPTATLIAGPVTQTTTATITLSNVELVAGKTYLVAVAIRDGELPAVSSVVHDGATNFSSDEEHSQVRVDNRCELWHLDPAASSATADLVVTFAEETARGFVSVYEINGNETGDTFGPNVGKVFGNLSTVTATLTSTEDNSLLFQVMQRNASASPTSNTGTTLASQSGGSNLHYVQSQVANETGSHDVTATYAAGAQTSAFAVEILPAVLQPPGAPTGLSATADGHDKIDLSWTAPDPGDGTISGYQIQRRSPGGSGEWSTLVEDTESTSTSYSDTGLEGSTEYEYQVAAWNEHGLGDFSTADDATTDAPPPPTALCVTETNTLGSHEITNSAGSGVQVEVTETQIEFFGGTVTVTLGSKTNQQIADEITADVPGQSAVVTDAYSPSATNTLQEWSGTTIAADGGTTQLPGDEECADDRPRVPRHLIVTGRVRGPRVRPR